MSDTFQAASSVPAPVASVTTPSTEIELKLENLELAIKAAIKAKEKIEAILKEIVVKITENELSEIRPLVDTIEIVYTEAKIIAQFYCGVDDIEMEKKFQKMALNWEDKIIDLMQGICRLINRDDKKVIIGKMELSPSSIDRWTAEDVFTRFFVDQPYSKPITYGVFDIMVVAPAAAAILAPVASSGLAEAASATVVQSQESIRRQQEINLAISQAQRAIQRATEILTVDRSRTITEEESTQVLALLRNVSEVLSQIKSFVEFLQENGDTKESKHWEDIRLDYLHTYYALTGKHLEAMRIEHDPGTVIEDMTVGNRPFLLSAVRAVNVAPAPVAPVPVALAPAAPAAAEVDPILYAEAVPSVAPASTGSAVSTTSDGLYETAFSTLATSSVPTVASAHISSGSRFNV